MTNESECQTRLMETSQTKTIQVVLNGEQRSVPVGLTVDLLLGFLEMDPSRVAVESANPIGPQPRSARARSSKLCGSSAAANLRGVAFEICE
jgi:sulfur carrier protein ThiS